MAKPAESSTAPFQLLIVVRALTEIRGVYTGIHSTIAQFNTKAAADIAFANVSELVNASGEYSVTKLYV